MFFGIHNTVTSLTSCRLVSKVLDQPYLVQACEQGTGPALPCAGLWARYWTSQSSSFSIIISMMGSGMKVSSYTQTWCYIVSLACSPSYCKVNFPFNLFLLAWSVLCSPKIIRFLKENVDIKVLSLRIRAEFYINILSFVYMYYEG